MLSYLELFYLYSECVKDEIKKSGQEKVSLEKLTEICLHVFRKARAESKRPS